MTDSASKRDVDVNPVHFEAGKDLKSIKHAYSRGDTCGEEEDGKWDPTKDLVGGYLVIGETGFVFSAHGVKVSEVASCLLQRALNQFRYTPNQ